MADHPARQHDTPSLGLGRLAPAQWERLQDCIDRFEAAWESGDTVVLAEFLPPSGDELRPILLVELIKTDLDIRWQRGQRTTLEAYLHELPELGGASALSPQLILEEYRVRHQFGDRPALETYRVRFPVQFDQLQRLAPKSVSAATDHLPAPPPRPMLGPSSGGAGGLSFVEGYRLIKRIGSGGFGEVWRAEAPGGVAVAIKVIIRPIDQAEAQRERDALELVKGVRHPFLMQTHAFSVLEDRLLIVTELADGNLRDRLKDCRDQGLPTIPQEELLLYFRESAEGLDFLHTKGIQHRDIKPDNILLLAGHAKVADFGLAKLIESRHGGTATGAGTPPYLPPEGWDGKIHEHSDQYSLAIAYAELRLLRRPFPGRELRELMMAHLEQTPDLDPLPPPEQMVILKGLAKDPTARYGSCVAFAQALREAWMVELKRTGDSERRKRGGYGSVLQGTQPRRGVGRASLEGRATATASLLRSPSDRGTSRPRRLLIAACGVGGLAILAGLIVLVLVLVNPSAKQTTEPQVWTPPGFRAAESAELVGAGQGGERRLPSRIVSDTDPSLAFVLVPRTKPSDPEPFYMLQGKVTQGQLDRWRGRGASGEPDLPAFNVSIDDAIAFAASLGGYLPTTQQWDKAAGRFEEKRGRGPYLEPWTPGDIAIGGESGRALPMGQGRGDRSVLGCTDMAGNGLEWTRNLEFDQQNRLVPLAQPSARDRIELRGRSYRSSQPLGFDDPPDGEFYLDPEDASGRRRLSRDDIGFRVVLEPSP